MPVSGPKVLFRGKLKLTAQAEARLIEHAIKRRQSIRTNQGFMNSVAAAGMGVQPGVNTYWSGNVCTGWARIRQEAYASYENDFTFRTLATKSGRFSNIHKSAQFNLSVNVPARAVNVYKARACEALVNTSPFTGFMPEGKDDNADAIKLAERVFNNELEEGEARFHFREAITQACLSEAVMKSTLVPTGGNPETVEVPLWLDIYGNLKRDSRGSPIFGDDALDDHPQYLGAKVLRRDPRVEFFGKESLSAPQQMLRNKPTTDQLDVRPVGWENFGCNILEPNIHTADAIYHEVAEDYDTLMRRTQGVKLNQSVKSWLQSVKESAARYPQTEGQQPHFQRGEWEVDAWGPIRLNICEMWLRFDVFDRGQADEICFMWAVGGDGTEAFPIYYDLMQDASPTGKRPFEVLRVIPVRQRWYGMGFYDLLSDDHAFIDDAWNRIRARSSASGRIDWMRRDSFEGLEYGAPVSMSQGKVYVVKSSVAPTDPIEGHHIGSIKLPEMDERIWEMLKMALQTAQLRSGTMTASDAAASELPANNTATGQNLLENESQLMSQDTTQDLIRGIVAVLKQSIMAVFSTPDEATKARFAERVNMLLGPEDGEVLLEWLQTAKPEEFSKHVKLLLTKARSKQALEAATGINLTLTGGMSFLQLAQQMPGVAQAMIPAFNDMLTARDMSNSDQTLKTILQEVQAYQMAAAPKGLHAPAPTQNPVAAAAPPPVP